MSTILRKKKPKLEGISWHNSSLGYKVITSLSGRDEWSEYEKNSRLHTQDYVYIYTKFYNLGK